MIALVCIPAIRVLAFVNLFKNVFVVEIIVFHGVKDPLYKATTYFSG